MGGAVGTTDEPGWDAGTLTCGTGVECRVDARGGRRFFSGFRGFLFAFLGLDERDDEEQRSAESCRAEKSRSGRVSHERSRIGASAVPEMSEGISQKCWSSDAHFAGCLLGCNFTVGAWGDRGQDGEW